MSPSSSTRRALPLRAAGPALAALLAAACAAPLPAGPAPGAIARTGTATVTLLPARAYALQDGTVHRWLRTDVLAYEVRLARQAEDGSYAEAGGELAAIPVKGPAPATQAVFGGVQLGFRYRAFVRAFGNPGGVVVDGDLARSERLPMTAVAGTADFDFADGEVPVAITQPVQVELDVVPFAGKATVTFGAPSAAPYLPPGSAVTAEAN